MTDALIDASAARALAEGRHGDPFSVLGLHQRAGKWVVTAFVPGAEHLWVLTGKTAKPVAATPVHGTDGLFVAALPKKADYRLRAQGHGAEWDFDDPFRFGPVLGEMDEYLLGEGTLKRLWQVLGAHEISHQGVTGTHFAVWAPNAERVSVVGDFNVWDGRRHPMRRRGPTGCWDHSGGFHEVLYRYRAGHPLERNRRALPGRLQCFHQRPGQDRGLQRTLCRRFHR